MSPQELASVETLAEAAAHRSMSKLLTQLLPVLLAGLDKDSRSQVTSALRDKLIAERGRLLYTSPPALSPELSKAWNASFQNSFAGLV
jgi:hypothetical protein